MSCPLCIAAIIHSQTSYERKCGVICIVTINDFTAPILYDRFITFSIFVPYFFVFYGQIWGNYSLICVLHSFKSLGNIYQHYNKFLQTLFLPLYDIGPVSWQCYMIHTHFCAVWWKNLAWRNVSFFLEMNWHFYWKDSVLSKKLIGSLFCWPDWYLSFTWYTPLKGISM